jgi:hypothetical protein
MNVEIVARRALVVIDRELRREFPDDFYARCYYSAAALTQLIRDNGGAAALKTGNMAGFIVSIDGQQAGLKGFGGSPDGTAHLWVEAAGRLFDLSFHYLPYDAQRASVAMPVVAWESTAAHPDYLQYEVLQDTTQEGHFTFDEPAKRARLASFIDKCRARFRAQTGNPKLPFWLLERPQSVVAAASRGDAWANAALRFQSMGFGKIAMPR